MENEKNVRIENYFLKVVGLKIIDMIQWLIYANDIEKEKIMIELRKIRIELKKLKV